MAMHAYASWAFKRLFSLFLLDFESSIVTLRMSEDGLICFTSSPHGGQLYPAVKISNRERLSLHQVQADENQDPVVKDLDVLPHQKKFGEHGELK